MDVLNSMPENKELFHAAAKITHDNIFLFHDNKIITHDATKISHDVAKISHDVATKFTREFETIAVR